MRYLAAACAVFGLSLLGLPGALLVRMAAPLIDLIFGSGAMNRLPPGSFWPGVLYLSLLWPLGLILAERATAQVRHLYLRMGLFLLIVVFFCFLLVLVFYLLIRS